MPRLTAGVLAIALVATACSVQPIEDPGIGAGSLTTTVYAADGSVLTEWHAGEDRVLVSYEEMPRALVDAVVAIEDQRFWIHSGVDVRAVARALSVNVTAGDVVQGASTITQQYAKNVLLTPDVTLERKAQEVGLALRLEESFTKQEILERYLNTIFFGEGAYGVEAAARRFFDVPVSELTLGQSSLLAGLIKAPTTLNPYEAPNAALARRVTVLDKMVELGWIGPGQADLAAIEPLNLVPRGTTDEMRFPYFTDEVRRSLLANPALGDTPEERIDLLTRGGLRIYTTVRPDVQEAAETAAASVLPADGPSAGIVAIDPRNGHVVAVVGGRDFYDLNDPIAQFNLATQGNRQAGSAFKPIALAAALEAGHDLETRFPGGRRASIDTAIGTWEVTNYESAYYPSITLGEATVFSVNVPYAHLVDSIGPQAVVDMATKLGISSELESLHSVVLGAEEVTVLDMAEAYATIATGGIHTDPAFVTLVEAPDGTVLYRHVPTFTRALDEAVADLITATLVDVVRRGTGQQAKIGRPVAGKTGTTEGNHDAWFIGYTPELVGAVWVGFGEGNTALTSPATPYTITGGTWPAQIWSRMAISALSGVSYSPTPVSDGADLVSYQLDTSTGFLAGPLCPRSNIAHVQMHPAVAPSVICPIHNPPGLTNRVDGNVPALEGYEMIGAVSLLEASGFQVALEWDPDVDVAPGVVVDQFPEAGLALDGGSTVWITIAGTEPGTIIPNVIGKFGEDASARLSALGVIVDVIVLGDPTPEAGESPDLVWAQVPEPGTPVTDRVTIWINPEQNATVSP